MINTVQKGKWIKANVYVNWVAGWVNRWMRLFEFAFSVNINIFHVYDIKFNSIDENMNLSMAKKKSP